MTKRIKEDNAANEKAREQATEIGERIAEIAVLLKYKEYKKTIEPIKEIQKRLGLIREYVKPKLKAKDRPPEWESRIIGRLGCFLIGLLLGALLTGIYYSSLSR